MSTPHNAAKKGDIAPNVLMAGDPLRAQFTAEKYLENPVCFNTVRGMLGYTGTYKGKPVSIMGHGMGIPSIGIYTYELFHFYDVENIIRFGSAGALHPDLHLGDIVIAEGACTDSNYMAQFQLPGTFAPIADWKLLSTAARLAEGRRLKHVVGNVLSSDVFYSAHPERTDLWRPMGVLCVEMEISALYANAAFAGKHALGILSISDVIGKNEEMTPEERQTKFTSMMELALDTVTGL